MTVILLLLGGTLFVAGTALNALLPHLPADLILPGVAVVGALWLGGFGTAYMGLVVALVDLCTRVHRTLAICRKV